MSTRQLFDLSGLVPGCSQVLGAVRLVPLLRTGPRASSDLRVAARPYGDAVGLVSLDGAEPFERGLKYLSFVPHGLVVSYTTDGSPVAALGAWFGASRAEQDKGPGPRLVPLRRMVKREQGEGSTQRLRMLPLHLAMEGFLALHFGGPDIMWQEYSKEALRHGLDPRGESSVSGGGIARFDRALRTFEILEGQVGSLVFVADALASAFVVPHPDDYVRLHQTLLDDFYGQLLATYALLYPDTPPVRAELLRRDQVASVADLAAEVERVRGEHRAYADLLLSGLVGRDVDVACLRTMGPFRLERFLPVFDPDRECHIGERIVRDDGAIEYLKTFRLSAAQVRRAFLLSHLARVEWKLEDAARALRTDVDGLVRRLDAAGFGYLVRADILRRASPAADRR